MPTTVVKLGGSALERAEEVLAGLRGDVVLVHGGGAAVSAMSRRLGLQPRFVDGLRVTDADTLEVALMVQGTVNRRLVGLLGRQGVKARGLFGHDHGGWLRAEVLGDGRWGHVGDITGVDVSALDGPLPVVAPVAVDDRFRPLNVNADHVAAALATALGADRLVFVTDVDAIRGSEGPLHALDAESLARLCADGTVHGGMLPKARAALGAVSRGVKCVTVGSGLHGGTEVWA